jgi:hypothetical protein
MQCGEAIGRFLYFLFLAIAECFVQPFPSSLLLWGTRPTKQMRPRRAQKIYIFNKKGGPGPAFDFVG